MTCRRVHGRAQTLKGHCTDLFKFSLHVFWWHHYYVSRVTFQRCVKLHEGKFRTDCFGTISSLNAPLIFVNIIDNVWYLSHNTCHLSRGLSWRLFGLRFWLRNDLLKTMTDPRHHTFSRKQKGGFITITFSGTAAAGQVSSHPSMWEGFCWNMINIFMY